MSPKVNQYDIFILEFRKDQKSPQVIPLQFQTFACGPLLGGCLLGHLVVYWNEYGIPNIVRALQDFENLKYKARQNTGPSIYNELNYLVFSNQYENLELPK